MEIEQNTISRDWTIVHEGRRFFVNFTNSDGQTLGLCNRENWQIHEETADGTEELNVYGSKSYDDCFALSPAVGSANIVVFCRAACESVGETRVLSP